MPTWASLAAWLLVTLVPASPLVAQASEQRYSDWTKLDFRPQEYLYRRSRMLELLAESGGGVLLVPSSDGRTGGATFRQLDDFWYFTGLELPSSMLVFDAGRKRTLLFMPPRDARFEDADRPEDFPGRPLLDDYQIRGISGIDEFLDVAELEAYVKGWIDSGIPIRLNGGTPGPMTAPEAPLIGHLDQIETLHLRLVTDHPTVLVDNAYAQIARLRMVKTPAEIRHLRLAAEATAEGIRRVAEAIRAGRDERSLQGVFEETCRSLGAQGVAFASTVKSGPNSLWPSPLLGAHYDRRNRTMEDDELVVVDVGCEIDGYASEVGRTFPVTGTFNDDQREKLLVSARAADAIIAAARPGITLRELTHAAYDAIPDQEEGYMRTTTFFGHHIGMSASDPSLIDQPLEPGMVFTVEPWYSNHDLGVSVLLQDMVLITDEGAEVLTAQLGRTPEQLEDMVGPS